MFQRNSEVVQPLVQAMSMPSAIRAEDFRGSRVMGRLLQCSDWVAALLCPIWERRVRGWISGRGPESAGKGLKGGSLSQFECGRSTA